MENAADALKMAAEMLLFLLALGITISSFSQARETSEILLSYTDRDYVTQYVEDLETTQRVVSIETIIPTIYRAYKENYKIYFYDVSGNPLELYTIKDTQTGAETVINAIDSTEDTLGDDWQKDNFIMALLYGKDAETLLKDKNGNSILWEDFKTSLNTGNSVIDLKDEGIYDKISSSRFKEYFGVYYPSQATENAGDGVDPDDTNQNAQTTTESKMRVISYQAYNG